jgi:2-dehydro-3-deoxygalactonokinase
MTDLASLAPAVAIDGGTSTTRARLVVSGRVVAEARRAVGVRDTVLSGRSTLVEAVRACLDELATNHPLARSAPIVAAGMLTSEVGLVAVPHVVAPAGLGELAAGASERVVEGVSGRPILFIPGVRMPPGDGPEGWTEADVMRGEECESLGAWHALGLDRETTFVWPGSHTKVVFVDADGRITWSTTTLAGEMAVAIARQTILAKSLPDPFPDDLDPEALALGVRLGATEGLGRAAFLVRIADLTGAFDLARRAAFWVGAIVGDECEDLATGKLGGRVVRVGGRQPQRSLYADRLRAIRGEPTEPLDDDLAAHASAFGALAVAARAGWLTPSA